MRPCIRLIPTLVLIEFEAISFILGISTHLIVRTSEFENSKVRRSKGGRIRTILGRRDTLQELLRFSEGVCRTNRGQLTATLDRI